MVISRSGQAHEVASRQPAIRRPEAEPVKAFIAQGLVPAYKGPGAFGQFMEAEIKLWMGLVRDTGISVD